MLFPLTLPFCLSPIFIVYIPRLGASIIPEDELPIKQIAFLINNDKHLYANFLYKLN